MRLDDYGRKVYARERRAAAKHGRERLQTCGGELYGAARPPRAAYFNASDCLDRARAEMAKDPRRPIYTDVGIWRRPWHLGAVDDGGERWIEDPESVGLRFHGLASDLAKLDHDGWFMDPEALGETARGVVYQLPAKNGRARFLAAMADPWNSDTDGRGPAIVDVRQIFEADAVALWSEWQINGQSRRPVSEFAESAAILAAKDAARMADEIARIYAEREREYQEARRAGERSRELAREAFELGREYVGAFRAVRQAVCARRLVVKDGVVSAADWRDGVRGLVKLARRARESYVDAIEAARDFRNDSRPSRGPLLSAWADGYAEADL